MQLSSTSRSIQSIIKIILQIPPQYTLITPSLQGYCTVETATHPSGRLRQEDAVAVVAGLAGAVGGCVLAVGGFVVFEGGHDGLSGWMDCEGVVVFDLVGLVEHSLAAVQVYLQGQVLVDRLDAVLEVVGGTVVVPAQAVLLVHQFVIHVGDGGDECSFQQFGVHQFPSIEDIAALSLLIMVVLLKDDAVVVGGIGYLLIVLGVLLYLDAGADEHRFHHLAEGFTNEAGVVVDHLAQGLYVQQFFLHLFDEHFVVAFYLGYSGGEIGEDFADFVGEVFHFLGTVEQFLTLLYDLLKLSLSYFFFLVCETDLDFVEQLSTLSIVLLSQLLLEFVAVFVEFLYHLRLETQGFAQALPHLYPFLFQGQEFIVYVCFEFIVRHF